MLGFLDRILGRARLTRGNPRGAQGSFHIRHSALSTLNSVLRPLRGRYDAAQTTYENRRHWANADHLSANATTSAEVRRILRSRARYEVANNSYAKGIVLTLANYVVGTGPRLQMLTDDPETNRLIEREFAR